MASPESRAWYLKRISKAALLGLAALVVIAAAMGFGVYFLVEYLNAFIPWPWLDRLAEGAFIIIWIILLYFSSGPITLVLMSFYLAQSGDWEVLRRSVRLSLPEFHEEFSVRELNKSILRALVLSIIILLAAIISLIPILFFLPAIVAGMSLGKEWVWTVDELFPIKERRGGRVAYCLGLGFVPAFLASIPILGVATIPIMQVASLIRYEESTILGKR